MPMGTLCALLVTDFCLCCYQRDFILTLADNNQADVAALTSKSRLSLFQTNGKSNISH